MHQILGCDIRNRKYVDCSQNNISLLVVRCGSLRCDILFGKSEQTLYLYMVRDILTACECNSYMRFAIL